MGERGLGEPLADLRAGGGACSPAACMWGWTCWSCPDCARYAVLEANAFGDLLPGVLCEGMDTYEAEARAVAGSAFRQ